MALLCYVRVKLHFFLMGINEVEYFVLFVQKIEDIIFFSISPKLENSVGIL